MNELKTRSLKTSVVIITYERPIPLLKSIESLEMQNTIPNEIIVIDSSKNIKLGKELENKNVIYYASSNRLYQPQARNIGLEMANGDIVAFIDDDIICNPEWLKNILLGYSYDNVVGVGGPIMRYYNDYQKEGNIIRSNTNQNYFTSSGDINVKMQWIPTKPIKTKLLMGGNMSFVKSELEAVDGFDEYYGCNGAYREETDPQIALIKKGFNFMYMPKAHVKHVSYNYGGIQSENRSNYYYWCGKYHKYFSDKYFSRILSRLSWIFWSTDPPCLWRCVFLALLRKNIDYLCWIKGLWFSKNDMRARKNIVFGI